MYRIILFFCAFIAFSSTYCFGQSTCLSVETTDIFGNTWCLESTKDNADAIISVQAFNINGVKLILEGDSGLPKGNWQFIVSDVNGFLWVGGINGLIRFDPRKPAKGWVAFNQTVTFKNAVVSAFHIGKSGLLRVTLRNGKGYEVDIDCNGKEMVSAYQKYNEKQTKKWEQLTPMPYSSHDVFGAALNGKIYVPGGGAPHGYPAEMTNFDRMLIYDVKKNKWSISSPMAKKRRYCNVGVIGEKVWVIGGYEKNEEGLTTVEIYDPSTDSWTSGPSLDYPCAQSVVAVVNNRLYVFFYDVKMKKGYGYSISSEENKWLEETASPYPVYQTDGCELNGEIFILIPAFGLVSYNPSTKLWKSDYPPFPNTKAPRAAAVASHRNEIWVISGADVETEKLVWRYSPKNRKWMAGPSFPQATLWADAIDVNNKLYVFGGAALSQRHGIFVFRNALFRL